MAPQQLHFTLPDLHALCPFVGSTNPHFAVASVESSAWFNSYRVFTGDKRTDFVRSSMELSASHAYPYGDHEAFRICCDWINLLFAIDEISDDQNGAGAAKTGKTYLRALAGEPCDGSKLSRMTTESRLNARASVGCQRRFYESSVDYMDATVLEAKLREQGTILGLEEYRRLRRENSGVRMCFALVEYALGLDLPEAVFDDPSFQAAFWAAVDMICWSNDAYSYNKEQAAGHGACNYVTVVMCEKHISLQDTMDYIGDVFKTLVAEFLENTSRIPSFGPAEDNDIQAFLEGMEYWVAGNLNWSFASQRYFGPEHDEVRKTLIVKLRPRRP